MVNEPTLEGFIAELEEVVRAETWLEIDTEDSAALLRLLKAYADLLGAP